MKYIELFFERNKDYIKSSDVPKELIKNTQIYYQSQF